MRKCFWALVLLFSLSPLGVAGADTMSVSQEIHITGVVAPMRFIVLDGQGNIAEITSNTPENITPKVYVGSIQHGTQMPLTLAVQKDYEAKISGHDMHSIDLHFPPPSLVTVRAQKSNLLAAIANISFLRSPLFHNLF